MPPINTQRRAIARFALASLAGLAATGAHTQSPAPKLDGPLRIVVGYAPGGATDRVARIVGDRLAARLGVPVVVENKPGAGGRLAAQQVKAARAGENVLMLANPAVMVVAPLVFKDSGYDPERDFQPISHVNDYEFGVVVGSAVPVKELSHLLAWLRANPAQANVGVPATGSLPHFFALMLGERAQVKTEVVGYRGSASVMTDLLGGQIPIAVDTFDVLLPQHEAGKVRVLAMSGAARSPFAPEVPTFKEAGLELTALGWNTFFAPAALPREKAHLLASEIQATMQEPATQRRFIEGKMLPVASNRAQTAAMLEAYRAQWAPVVRQSGYQP